MREYGYEMQRDFERGWAEFQAQEARRERRRASARHTGRIIAVVAGVAILTALGAIVAIAIFWQPWEVAAWLR